MALTLRTNGSSGINLVSSIWWNDYYNLLTGVMNDQPVTVSSNLVLKAVANNPAAGLAAAAVAGSSLGVGTYTYAVTFSGVVGETGISAPVSVVTTGGNQSVNLTSIPLGPSGTTARKIYRTAVNVGGIGTNGHLLVILGNNTSTTYSDTVADATIAGNATPPFASVFGGSLQIVNSTNTAILHAFYADGTATITSLWLNPKTTYGTAFPTITLAIGDNDSGLNWESDGTFTFMSNNAVVARMTPGQLNIVGQLTVGGFGVATGGMRLWTGGSDPGGAAAEGDIWIKA